MAAASYQRSCGLGDESILESLLLEMVTENKAHESFAEPNLMENVSFVHRPSVKLHTDACPLSPSSGYSSGPEHSHKMLHSLSDRKHKSHKRQFEFPANDVHSVADILANSSMSPVKNSPSANLCTPSKMELNSSQVKDELSSCRSRKRKDKHKQSNLHVSENRNFVTSGSVIDHSVSDAVSKSYYGETLLPAHVEDSELSLPKTKKHNHKRSVAQDTCDYLDNAVECNTDLVLPATRILTCDTVTLPNGETNIAFQDPINKKEDRGRKKKHRVKEKTISPTLDVDIIVKTSKLNESESCSNYRSDYGETSFHTLVEDAELSELLKPKRHKHKHKRSIVQDISENVVDCGMDPVHHFTHISASDTANKGETDIPFHDPVSSKEERRMKKKHRRLKETTSPTLDVDSRFAGSESCKIRHDSNSETVDVSLSQMSDYHEDISRRKDEKKEKHRSEVHNIDGAVAVNTPDVTESYSGEVVLADDSEVGNVSSCFNERNLPRKRKKSKKHKTEYRDVADVISIDSKTQVVSASVSVVSPTADIDSPSLPPDGVETVSKRKHKKGKNHKLDDCQESVDIEMLVGLEAGSNNSFSCQMEKLPDSHDLLSPTTTTEFDSDKAFSERKHKRHRKQKTDTLAADARLKPAEVDKVEDSGQDFSGTGINVSSAAAIDVNPLSASFSENTDTVSVSKRKTKRRNVDVDSVNEYVTPRDSVDRTRDGVSENNTGKQVINRQSPKCKVKLNTVPIGSDDILNSISNSKNSCSFSLDVPSASDQLVDAVLEECQHKVLLERTLTARQVENGFVNMAVGSNGLIDSSRIHDDLEAVESTGNSMVSQGYNQFPVSPALVTDQKMESVQMQRLGLGTEASFEHLLLLLTEMVACDPVDKSEHQGIQNSARNRLCGHSLVVAEFTSSDSEDETFQNINWNISHKSKSRAEGARLAANAVMESEVSFSAGLNFCINARNHIASPRNNSVADFVKGYSSCSDVEPLTDKDGDSAARIRTSTQKTPVRSAVPAFELKNTGGIQDDGNSSLLSDKSGSRKVLNQKTKSGKLSQDCADNSDGAPGAGSQDSDRHAIPAVDGDGTADTTEPLTVRVIMLSPARTRQKRKRSSETEAESVKGLNSRTARRVAAKNVADAKRSVVSDAGKKYKRRKLDLNDRTELPLETNAENTGSINAVPAQLPTDSNTEIAMSAASDADADEDDVVMDSNSDSSSPENSSQHRRKCQKSLCGNVEMENFPTPSSQVGQHSRNIVSPDLFQSDSSASEENDVQHEEENVANAEHSSSTKILDTVQQKLLKESGCLENSDLTPSKTPQPSSSIHYGKQEKKVVTKVCKTPARVTRPLQVRVGPSSVTKNTSASKNRSRQPAKAAPSATKVPLPGGNSSTTTLRSRSRSGDADTSYSSRSSRLSVVSDVDDEEFDDEWVTEENLERLHAKNYRNYLRTRKQVQEAGLLRCCKFGQWSDYEFHCLKDNWNELIKDCPLPDPTVLLSCCSSLDKPTKLALTRYVVTSDFYKRLARNIPRTIFAVCEKARRTPELIDSRTLSKWAQYRLRLSHKKYGDNWQKIAASTGLSEQECREALNCNDDGDASVDQHQEPRQHEEQLEEQQQQQEEELQPRQHEEELQHQQQQQPRLQEELQPRQQPQHEEEMQQQQLLRQEEQQQQSVGIWTEEEITLLRNAAKLYIKKSDDVSNVFSLPWAKIAMHIPTRSRKQCRNKWLSLSTDGSAEFPLAEKMRAVEEILASQAMDEKEFDWNSLWSKFNYLPSPQFLRASVLRLKRVHVPSRRRSLPWRDCLQYLLQVTFPKLDRHHTFTKKKSPDSTGKTIPSCPGQRRPDKRSVKDSDSSRKARSSSRNTQPSCSSQEPTAGCSRAVSGLPQDTLSSPQTTRKTLRSCSVRKLLSETLSTQEQYDSVSDVPLLTGESSASRS